MILIIELVTRDVYLNILELVTKEKNKHCRERKKGISEFASSKIELTGHNDVTF